MIRLSGEKGNTYHQPNCAQRPHVAQMYPGE